MSVKRRLHRNSIWRLAIFASLFALGCLGVAGHAARVAVESLVAPAHAAPAAAAPAASDSATPPSSDAGEVSPPPAASSPPPPVHVLTIDDRIISPVIQAYVLEGIQRAESENAGVLVLMLDTPGGLMDSSRQIVKAMMNARVPLVVYVAPSGSRAASAGVFITLAAHVAAMAPSTHIGAAHPVAVGGGGGELFRQKDEEDDTLPKWRGKDGSKDDDADTTPTAPEKKPEVESYDPMADKILHDTVAWVRSIAATRGRNVEWAEKAVTQSLSITQEEALEKNVIDLIATDLDDLLRQIDGRAVEVLGREVTLRTDGAPVHRHPMSGLQRFLAIITHPNVAYLLMMLGTLGLIFEFTHPGIGFPGIAGGICILLALYAFQILPISYVALALLVLGVILFVAEAQVTSYGLLALGGIVSLVLGGLLLVESPDPALRVSLSVILPMSLTMGAITMFLLFRVVRSRRIPVATGDEGMLGEVGTVATDLNPEGYVFIHSENWRAWSREPIARGTRVRAVRVEGLRLEVEPLPPDSTHPPQA